MIFDCAQTEHCFTSQLEAFPSISPSQVAVLLTDGQQSVVPGSVDVAVAAKGLRDSDVEIFAVGIGPEIDLLQLNEMVSKPSFVFYASDFDRLLREISTEIALALRCTGSHDACFFNSRNRAGRGRRLDP